MFCSAVALGGVACQNTEPVSIIGSCEGIVRESARGTDAVVRTSCPIGQALWVVALPGSQVASSDLTVLGIPEDAALMMSRRDTVRPEWCAVNELSPESPPGGVTGKPMRRFERRCIDTLLTIQAPAAVRTDTVVISAQRAEGGAIRLVGLSGQ